MTTVHRYVRHCENGHKMMALDSHINATSKCILLPAAVKQIFHVKVTAYQILLSVKLQSISVFSLINKKKITFTNTNEITYQRKYDTLEIFCLI